MNTPVIFELERLLLSLFDLAELRRFFREHGLAPDLELQIPTSLGPALFVGDLVSGLDRRGLVDSAFFEMLRQARPQRSAEIAGVFSTWEISQSDQRPAPSTVWVELILASGTMAGWPVLLRLGSVIEIGRDTHLRHRLPFADRKASRRHARIVWAPNGITLYDLSKNGCWLNNRRIRRALLRNDDHLRFGSTEIVVKDVDGTLTVGTSDTSVRTLAGR